MKVVDMHCDTILRIFDEGGNLLENDFNIDLRKMSKGDYLLQNFAMFVNLGDNDDPLIKAHRLIDLYYQEIERIAQAVHFATKHKADSGFRYFPVEHTLVVLVIEHTDIARTGRIKIGRAHV